MGPAVLAFGVVVLVILIIVAQRNRRDRRGGYPGDGRPHDSGPHHGSRGGIFGDNDGDGDGGDGGD